MKVGKRIFIFILIFSLNITLPLEALAREKKTPSDKKTPKGSVEIEEQGEDSVPESSGEFSDTAESSTSSTSSAVNQNTGADSENEASSTYDSETSVENENDASITNNLEVSADTGGNVTSYNTGNAAVITGDALVNVETENNVNFNTTSFENGESEGEGGFVSEAENENTGANSENTATSETTIETDIENENNLDLLNEFDIDANTGENESSFNTGHGDIKTGEAEVSFNLLNFANTNIVGEGEIQEYDIYGEYEEDIVFVLSEDGESFEIASSDFNTANENTGANSENTAESTYLEDTEITNSNVASLTNDVNIEVNTGENRSDYNTGNGGVETGDINIALNILNFLNNNIAASEGWLLGVVNIFGKLSGDITFPYFESSNGSESLESEVGCEAINSNTGAGSQNSAECSFESNTEITNENELNLTNNLEILAETGENEASFNTGSGSVESGISEVQTSVNNISNINQVGGDWWLVLVNNLGNWTGVILGAEGQVTKQSLGNEVETDFLTAPTIINTVSNSNTGANSENTASSNISKETTINNSNQAEVTNNIVVSGNTGGNTSSYNTGSGSVKSGNVDVATNLFNFINNNFVGRTFLLGIINVFGEWLGDLIPPDEEKIVEEESEESLVEDENGVGSLLALATEEETNFESLSENNQDPTDVEGSQSDKGSTSSSETKSEVGVSVSAEEGSVGLEVSTNVESESKSFYKLKVKGEAKAEESDSEPKEEERPKVYRVEPRSEKDFKVSWWWVFLLISLSMIYLLKGRWENLRP